jgi:pimeloyl-ACP methyl ester carboxylesterase
MSAVAAASKPVAVTPPEPEHKPRTSPRMAIPILLIPGLNATAEVYAHQVPALWQFGPVTIADHRTGTTMAEIAAAILKDAPPTFALAGFSMGGYIAFEILRRRGHACSASRCSILPPVPIHLRPRTSAMPPSR